MITESHLQAKFDLAEAKADSKFAQVLAEVKIIGIGVAALTTTVGQVQTDLTVVKASTVSVKWNILTVGLGTGIALGGLVLGLFAFGSSIMEMATGLVGLHK
jgi:hypothetical protein